jgi:hypothetical protein
MTTAAADWLRGEGGQLVVEVGIAEGPATDAGAGEMVASAVQRGFILDGADDEMGMLRLEPAEGVDGLGDGVAGLNDLLSLGKVFADDDVQVRNLVEHVPPPLG